jgi:pyruvate dehydrogenase E2 component (dihydrolipoamide acetyltransferase)
MAFSVQMPALGESVTEGTVTRWLKQEGDQVEVDEPLLEVSTDKVDTEIPSPAAGVLQRIVAGEDETVEVGGELAVIGDAADEGGSDDGGGADDGDQGSDDGADTASAEDQDPGGEQQQPAEEASKGDEPTEKPKADTKSAGSGTAVTMPELGESVTEGTVTRWLKQVGDQVEVDEPLLEVSTDKVDTEIPSPIAGTLLEIVANEDDTVDVGGTLAVIGDESDASGDSGPSDDNTTAVETDTTDEAGTTDDADTKADAGDEPSAASETPAETPAEEPQGDTDTDTDGGSHTDAEEAERASSNGKAAPSAEQSTEPPSDAKPATGAPYVTPLVRKLASEHGVDLATVSGTGVGGRIRKQDVLSAAEQAAPEPEPQPATAQTAGAQPAAASSAPSSAPKAPTTVPSPAAGGPQPGSTVKLPRLRQVIAQRMTESLQISAQLTTVQQVDVTRITRLRARAKAEFERREGVKLTYLPFYTKATIEALKAFPQLNASIDTESKEVTYHGAVHLAIAVDTPRGLLVPVIKDAEDLNITGLAKRIADVAARTRDNKIGPSELSGGTFTITNIGSVGALFDTPIINQPQVAILGTGAIVKEPAVITGPDGEDVIAIRSRCYLPLTYDHRLVDGADAGRFVSAIKARLEEGAFESELGL